MATRVFTLEEANRTLPLVQRIAHDIVATNAELQRRVAEHSAVDSSAPDAEARRRELRDRIDSLTGQVNAYINELHSLGCQFKDFEMGLVDFYALKGGRPIFLCWKLGEERIEWWHEVDAGYRGRQPVADLLE